MRQLVFLFLLCGTQTAFSQSISIDFDKTVDFSAVSTYAWQKGTIEIDRLNHQRIVNAINNELSIKGLELVEDNPDVLITYHASSEKELRVTDFGYSRPRWGVQRDIDVRNILKGTLVFDMLNPENELIWRGIASGSVSSKPEKNEKKINKAVQKMLKKFPPQKK